MKTGLNVLLCLFCVLLGVILGGGTFYIQHHTLPGITPSPSPTPTSSPTPSPTPSSTAVSAQTVSLIGLPVTFKIPEGLTLATQPVSGYSKDITVKSYTANLTTETSSKPSGIEITFGTATKASAITNGLNVFNKSIQPSGQPTSVKSTNSARLEIITNQYKVGSLTTNCYMYSTDTVFFALCADSTYLSIPINNTQWGLLKDTITLESSASPTPSSTLLHTQTP